MHPFQTITLKKNMLVWQTCTVFFGDVQFSIGVKSSGCAFCFTQNVSFNSMVFLYKKSNWASLNGVSHITFFSEERSYFQTFRRTETMFSLVSEAFPSNDSDAFAKERDFSKKWRYFPQDSWIFVERSMTLLSFVYIKKWCHLQT